MRAFLFYFFLIGLFNLPAKAQQKEGAWWFFGSGFQGSYEGPTLHFNGNKIEQGAYEAHPSFSVGGTSTISDQYGNLLFYTDSGYPHTRNFTLSANPPIPKYPFIPAYFRQEYPAGGLSIYSPIDMLVQSPADPQVYFHFFFYDVTWGGWGGYPKLDTTYFNVGQLSLRLNNGFGDAIPNALRVIQKNAAIKMAALLHTNNRDTWILTHNREGTHFYAYLLSPAGISAPVITPTGRLLSETGRLKSSPNSGQFTTNSAAGIELFDFDRSTGVPTFRQTLTIPVINPLTPAYSTAFSPDGSKLYVGSGNPEYPTNQPDIPAYKAYLYQFNLASGSPAAVQSSRFHVFTFDSVHTVFDMQVAIDGKIYLTKGYHEGSKYLSRINCPDQPGAASRFRYNEIYLQGSLSGRNLPALNQTIFRNAGILQAQAFRDTICYGDSVQLSAYGAGAELFQWQIANGLTSPNDTLSNPFVKPTATTTYTVTGSSVCNQNTASVTVVVLPKPVVSVSGSASVCPQVQGVWYKANNPEKLPISWGVKGGSIATSSNDSISVNWGNASNTAQVWALPRNRLGCPGDTVFFPVNINVILATETPKGADTLCLNEAKNINYHIAPTTGSVYTWGINGGTITSGQSTNAIQVTWQQTGQNKLWVHEESQTSTSHCFGISDTLSVLVHSSPDSLLSIKGAPQVFTLTENQLYEVVNPQTGLIYNWQISGGKLISGQGSDMIRVNWETAGTGQVEVSTENAAGCESNKVVLKVDISGSPQPVFYNIITPNKDGKNDAFVIENLKWYSENELIIYNRWGVQVYQTSNYQNDWQADKVSSGVYYYRFQTGTKTWKGWLEVVK